MTTRKAGETACPTKADQQLAKQVGQAFSLPSGALPAKSARPWRDFLRVKPFLRPYAGPLLLMLALSLFGSLLGLAQPYLSKYLVDNALLRKDMHALWLAALLMFAATALGFGMSYISGYGYMRLSASMLFDMRLAVYRHLHTLSPRFYARARLGDLVSRLNSDVAEVQRISADSFLSFLTNIVFIAGSLGMMILLNWKLFILGVILIPLAVALFRYYQIRITKLALELREHSAGIGTLFVETLIGMRLLACFNASDYELDRFRQRNDSFVACLMRFQGVSLMGRTLPGTIFTGATIVVFLYGGRQIILGHMSIGTLVAFMAYHARLLSPVQSLLGLSGALATAKVSLGRVLELLDTPAEIVESPHALPIENVSEGIELRNVTLLHEGRTVLDGVSCILPAGQFSVICGHSGSGKSTIADLLVRLLDPDSGTVLIDGVDVRELRLKDLRNAVVLIEQSPHLLQGSLFDNIAYAKSGVSRDHVAQAAEAAGLKELLERLPLGLDTIAGERGLTLSAGERQRVAIARAFLSNPDVLILDEPSAALDPGLERDLLESLRRNFTGKTLIAITHKPLLASVADQVIYLEQGRIMESPVIA